MLPRLTHRLPLQLAMAKPKRGGSRPRTKEKEDKAVRKDDVYEAQDSDPDELRHASRYDVGRGRAAAGGP